LQVRVLSPLFLLVKRKQAWLSGISPGWVPRILPLEPVWNRWIRASTGQQRANKSEHRSPWF